MVQLTVLYQENDPYCHQAQEALEHLRMEEGIQDIQLILIDVKAKGLTGKKAEALLNEVGVATNKNTNG